MEGRFNSQLKTNSTVNWKLRCKYLQNDKETGLAPTEMIKHKHAGMHAYIHTHIHTREMNIYVCVSEIHTIS